MRFSPNLIKSRFPQGRPDQPSTARHEADVESWARHASLGFNVPVRVDSQLRLIDCRDIVVDPYLESGTSAIGAQHTDCLLQQCVTQARKKAIL